jgi:hypothetical protein
MDLHLGCDGVSFLEWLLSFRMHLFFEIMGTTQPTRQSHFPEDVNLQGHSRVKFRSRKS